MAAPPEVNFFDLTGKFAMNKTLSDEFDPILSLQGVRWLTRKAIGLANVVLTVYQYSEDATQHIDIISVASGISTQRERRTLNWTNRSQDNKIFGKVVGKSRIVSTQEFRMEGPGEDADAMFLTAARLKNGCANSKRLDDEHVQSWTVGAGWTTEQLWGFEEIDGKRHYARRIIVKRGDKVAKARIVYDYKGPAEPLWDEEEEFEE